jgi:molecular chaperone GrpE (heat shock protein)
MQDLAIKKERTQFEEEIKELKDEIKRKNYDLEDMRRRLE